MFAFLLTLLILDALLAVGGRAASGGAGRRPRLARRRHDRHGPRRPPGGDPADQGHVVVRGHLPRARAGALAGAARRRLERAAGAAPVRHARVRAERAAAAWRITPVPADCTRDGGRASTGAVSNRARQDTLAGSPRSLPAEEVTAIDGGVTG